MHSTLQYGCSFDSNWQIYDSFNRKHKRLLDTYQEIRPDNFSFDTLCKKHIMLPLNCIRIHSLIITVFQQMFYMIITANICILKWSVSSFKLGDTWRGFWQILVSRGPIALSMSLSLSAIQQYKNDKNLYNRPSHSPVPRQLCLKRVASLFPPKWSPMVPSPPSQWSPAIPSEVENPCKLDSTSSLIGAQQLSTSTWLSLQRWPPSILLP